MQTHICTDKLSLRPSRWYIAGFKDRQDGVRRKFFGDNQSEWTSDNGRIDWYFFICDDFVTRSLWVE